MVEFLRFGIAYDIMVDEEVGIESHLVDDLQFFFKPLPCLFIFLSIAACKAIVGQLGKKHAVVFFGSAEALLVLISVEVHAKITGIKQLVGIGDDEGI